MDYGVEVLLFVSKLGRESSDRGLKTGVVQAETEQSEKAVKLPFLLGIYVNDYRNFTFPCFGNGEGVL